MIDHSATYIADIAIFSDEGDGPHDVVTLPRRVVRFGPPGWITVVTRAGAQPQTVELYPVQRILSVKGVKEDLDPPPSW